MHATGFERKHPAIVRLTLIALAVATYLFDPGDVVWRCVRNSLVIHQLERDL
jgi:hypothetical protein